MDAIQALRQRRTVRNYTGALIPREHLETIVDCGRLAASGSNHQPWDFIVVTDKAMMRRIKGNAEWIENAGAVIAVVMDPASRWWIEDGAAAVENMLLAATALGYGGCWLEGNSLRREDDLKLALGVPPEKRLMTLVPLGVPIELPKKEKKSLAEVIHWEKY